MAFRFSRLETAAALFGLLFFLLAGRLVYLQGVVGEELAALGLMGRMHELKAESLRGTIYDRNMEPLTGRRQVLSATFFPAQCRDRETVAALLQPYSVMDAAVFRRCVLEAKRPVRLIEDLTPQDAAKIAAAAPAGVVVAAEAARYGPLASHLIGYVDAAENRGVSGLEASCDDVLKDSGRAYLAAISDARSELIPGLSYRKVRLPGPQAARSLVLTIDARLQEKAEAVFDRYAKKGAVVLMEPRTGEILALVSRPNFDAGRLAEYLDDADAPLLNRAITAYQPGSVFKLAVAAAALEAGVAAPGQAFWDRGRIDVDGTVFYGWDRRQEARRITFQEAVAYSSNPVFIELGLKLGMDRLLPFLQRLGFGRQTALHLYGEAAGNLPDAARVYRGETANLSIGQGQCEATPLQIAALVASIVEDGRRVQPVLVKRVLDAAGNAVAAAEPPPQERLFSAATARTLREAMAAVTRVGTGQAAYVNAGGSAGKTGSAETGRIGADGKGVSHAWFAGYAPLARPAYVAVVFVEDGMSGGAVAAPIFRALLEAIEP